MKTTPRQLFRARHKDEASKLASEITQPWLQHTIAFTLAEMAAAGKSAHLVGATEFLNTLESLTEDDTEIKRQPDPALETYEPGWTPKSPPK